MTTTGAKMIKVTAVPSGVGDFLNVTVHPTQLHVSQKTGADVEWNLEGGTLTKVTFHVQLLKQGLRITSGFSGHIPPNTPIGTYAYAIEGEVGGKTFNIPNCPEIIIQ